MAGVKKVTISVPDGLLEEIDDLARQRGTTRSGVLQEAASEYVATSKAEETKAVREARWRDVEERLERIRKAPDLCPGETVLESIHRLRDERERRILGEDDEDE